MYKLLQNIFIASKVRLLKKIEEWLFYFATEKLVGLNTGIYRTCQ